MTCECEQITASYSIFLSISPTFHQICSSSFVSDELIPFRPDTTNGFSLGRFSFRLALAGYYATGRTSCSIFKDVASQVITTFLQTIYVSSHLTLANEFQSRMQASLNSFKASAPTTFNDLLYLIIYATQGNQLLTGGFNNAEMEYDALSTGTEDKINVLWINPINASCDCGMSVDLCSIAFNQYCNFTYNLTNAYSCPSPIEGLFISCYTMNSLLLSTLECLYDSQCLMPGYNNFLFENRTYSFSYVHRK